MTLQPRIEELKKLYEKAIRDSGLSNGAFFLALRNAFPAIVEALEQRWILVSEEPPQAGEPVLATCVNRVPLRAVYVPKHTMSEDEHGEFQGDTDYDESTDQNYWPEGWYEWNQFEETHWRISPDPTHYQLLPAPPTTKASAT